MASQHETENAVSKLYYLQVEKKQKTVLEITISYNKRHNKYGYVYQRNNKYGYVYHKTMDET